MPICECHERNAIGICGVLPNGVAPPVEFDTTARKLEAEKDEDHANRYTGIKSGREQVVEAQPPAEMPAAHNILEDESSGEPRGVVDTGRGRESVGSVEEDGEVDVSQPGPWVTAGGIVEWEGEEESDEEEPEERRVDLADREEALRTDGTPDKGRGEESIGRRA